MKTGHRVVDVISRLHISGNIVPVQWLRAIKTPTGKPHLPAVMILAELVFWHRWREVRDVRTGRLKKVVKKFKADMFQRSIAGWCELLELTPKQVRYAIGLLEGLGLIVVELRNPRMYGETKAYKTMFFSLVPERIASITFPPDETDALEGTGLLDDETDALEGTDDALQGAIVALKDTLTREHSESTTKSSPPSSPKSKQTYDGWAYREQFAELMEHGMSGEQVVRVHPLCYNIAEVVADILREREDGAS